VSIFSRRSRREPKIRERKGVSLSDLVPSPDELESRPDFRLIVIGLIALVLFAVMVLRLFTLQVVDAKTYRKAVNANQVRIVSIPAPRGLITARSNTVLVGNASTQEIVLSRQEAAQYPSVIGEVAALTNQTPAAVKKILANPKYDPYQPAPIMTNAPTATIQYLEEHQSEFPGVSVMTSTTRTYPQESLASPSTATHILGYVGAISAAQLAAHPNQGYAISSEFGQSGLEGFYESALRGTAGSEALAVNASGEVAGTLSEKAAVPGDTVVTNIDLGLQQYLQAVLHQQILTDRQTLDTKDNVYPPAINGAAIVMDPQTGAVLAMASDPTYDLSQFVGGISQSELNAILSTGALNNYAIQGLYIPGSTFKMVTATASLLDGLFPADKYVDDNGTFVVPTCQFLGSGCIYKDDENGGTGEVDLPLALTRSSDYYFYNLGYLFSLDPAKYGPTPIQDVAHNYGLDQPSGIDLPGESTGRIASQAEILKLHAESPKGFPNTTWYTGDDIEMAFGQDGTVVTPIGMAVAYSTLLNGGTRYEPEVAAGVVTSTGHVVERYEPRVAGHVALNSSITNPIIEGLLGVVNDPTGTAYSAFQQYAHYDQASFVVGGKTGTASNSPGQEPNSWFIGFGPGANPSYVVVCVIDQGGYGASAAAPVVAQVFNYLANNPVQPVVFPTPSNPPSTTPPAANPPAGFVPPTTTTTTTTTPAG
jgi:penicillin-binding protein 2